LRIAGGDLRPAAAGCCCGHIDNMHDAAVSTLRSR
jgi:hypothetical protein